jgi:hypothetical protein
MDKANFIFFIALSFWGWIRDTNAEMQVPCQTGSLVHKLLI